MTIATARRPLFLPLRREHFAAFADGSKTTEWRRWGPTWNEKIEPGREITLSCGYRGARLHGVVVRVERVERDGAPEGARAIYREAEAFCSIAISIEGRARLDRPGRRSPRRRRVEARQ